MRVEIRHVRRRQLAPFLPDEIAKTIKTTKDKAKKVRKYSKGRAPVSKIMKPSYFFQKSLTNKSIQPPQTSVVEEDMKDASKDKENNPNVRFHVFRKMLWYLFRNSQSQGQQKSILMVTKLWKVKVRETEMSEAGI